jgi:diguanylate cyclase (GGDEF)-like protein
MHLDLQTLLWVLPLTSGILAAAVLAVAWRTQVHKGLSLWGLGLVINTLSYPAFALRTLGWLYVSIVTANLLTVLTLVLHTLALMEFQRTQVRVAPLWCVWAPAALIAASTLLFMRDDHLRNVLTAGFQSAMAMVLLTQAWAPGLQKPRLTGRWVVVIGSLTLLVTLIARTVSMVTASSWDGHYNVPPHIQTVTYFGALAVLLTNSIGFVLMQMEHAISKQHHIAIHDQLTGLYNRYALLDMLDFLGAQSRRSGKPLAMLMLDIDYFKLVNDQHGHLVGDEVLRQVAQRAKNRLRQSDVMTRYGGEEFLALLPETDQEAAIVVAQDIRQAIEAHPMVVGCAEIPITISIGVHAGVFGNAPDAADASTRPRSKDATGWLHAESCPYETPLIGLSIT